VWVKLCNWTGKLESGEGRRGYKHLKVTGKLLPSYKFSFFELFCTKKRFCLLLNVFGGACYIIAR